MRHKNYINFDNQSGQLDCQDEWSISTLAEIKKNLGEIAPPKSGKLTINGKNISKMDTAGAWLLDKWIKKLSKNKVKVHLENFSEQHKKLLSFSKEQEKTSENIPPPKEELGWLQRLGKYSLQQADEFYLFVNFIGQLFYESIQVIRTPKLWRWNTIASVINKSGVAAMPIIALLSFMIGVVITYQMGNQLREYGANIFIVNLIGYSVLREFGPLLTAIMVAGRTGSAFTAQLGLMKINQEIDALNTLGFKSGELLILPRVIALFIVLPMLTILADIFGILGGMLMAQNVLGVTSHDFLLRFQHEIPLRALLIGLGKAPIFALIIATVGCFQGIAVRGSAENVGARTTRSVVLAIFFIIIVDAIISILLSKFNL